MSDLDWRLFKFFGDHMRMFDRAPALGQIRLHLRLKTKQQAKDALANLITYLDRTHPSGCRMNIPLGKYAGTGLNSGHGSYARRDRGRPLRENPQHLGELPRLGRKALISETQRLLLNFSIKEAAELQDATERAVESQRNGDSSISLQAAANMCRSSAKARALFAPLFGFTGHYADPDFMEGLEKVLQGYLNQQIPHEIDADEIEHEDLFGGPNV